MRSVSDKLYTAIQNKQFMYNNFFLKSCYLSDMWKNIVVWDRPQIKIWHMRTAFWTTMATRTHSEYLIIIAL